MTVNEIIEDIESGNSTDYMRNRETGAISDELVKVMSTFSEVVEEYESKYQNLLRIMDE